MARNVFRQIGICSFVVILLGNGETSAEKCRADSNRAEIVLDAADLAPAVMRADKPMSGKWWLRRDVKEWGTPKGNILMTGEITGKVGSGGEWQVTPAERFVAYRVPGLVVDPKATGWY